MEKYTNNLKIFTSYYRCDRAQKNKQRMTWTRDGANQILQIRASKLSNKWDKDWKEIEKKIYLKAA